MKRILKVWLITASIAAIINLIWFYINMTKDGNSWSEYISEPPILVATFGTMLVGTFVYWISMKEKHGEMIFKIGVIALTLIAAIGGAPSPRRGPALPEGIWIIFIPMCLLTGLLCALLVPYLYKRK